MEFKTIGKDRDLLVKMLKALRANWRLRLKVSSAPREREELTVLIRKVDVFMKDEFDES